MPICLLEADGEPQLGPKVSRAAYDCFRRVFSDGFSVDLAVRKLASESMESVSSALSCELIYDCFGLSCRSNMGILGGRGGAWPTGLLAKARLVLDVLEEVELRGRALSVECEAIASTLALCARERVELPKFLVDELVARDWHSASSSSDEARG